MVATQTIQASPSTERYAEAARRAGCPIDQYFNFVRADILMQPKQLAASAAARLCDQPDGPTEIGLGGARGPGKSFWTLAQMAADDCQRQSGLKCLLLRKVGKAGRESFEDLRRVVLRHLKHAYNRQEGILTFPNDSRIILGHFQNENDIDAYLGLEYDVISGEEATTLTSRKWKDIGTCLRTSKADWRPRRYNSTNPGNIGHTWYKQMFVDPYRLGRETDTRFFPCTVDDNKFVNPEYRAMLDKLTGWQYRAWRLGDWDIAAGQFFTTFRRDVHVIKPFEIPKGWRVWCALDYGFTHFTACHLLAQSGDGIVYVVDEHGERGWIPERHAVAIKAMLARHGRTLSDLWRFVAGADVFAKKQEGGTIADSYAVHGIKFTPANDDRINGAAEVLMRLGDVEATPNPIAPTLFILDRCIRLIENIPALQHDPHRPEDVLKVDCDDEGIGGDDWYDSARYGVMEVAQKRGSTAYVTAGTPTPAQVIVNGYRPR